jgi:hypothetical protein
MQNDRYQECSGLPDLPDFAHQRRPWLERDLPRLLTRRRHLACRADVLERLDLADQLVGIATHFGRQDLQNGVNDESPLNSKALV